MSLSDPGPIGGAATRSALVAAGDRPLVQTLDGQAKTAAQLEDSIGRIAGALSARSLTGRRVGLWYQNSIAALEAFLAIEWLGATRVPVDPNAAPSEAMSVFDAAGVDLALTDAARAPRLGGTVLVHDDEEPLDGRPIAPAPVADDTILHLFPRSVHGGELHAVPVTYGNWEARVGSSVRLYRRGALGPALGQDEMFLTAQQIMHGTSTIGTFPFIRMGLPQILLDRFDAERALETMLRERVTTTFFVPGMVTRLVASIRESGRRPTSLRRLLYGGAPFDEPGMLDSIDTLGGSLAQLYGNWAGAWPVSVLDGEDHLAIRDGDRATMASAGRPVDGLEIRLRPVPGSSSDAHELCVRGPVVVPEYTDANGWCGLGDRARLDDRGYLYIEGRIDGLISTGAYHVYPQEVEEALVAEPAVSDAEVRGEPDPVWGEAITAYVVASSAGCDPDLLRRNLRRRLAPYKVPKRIHLVEALVGTEDERGQ